jgi:AcrR family transcriptional regulator
MSPRASSLRPDERRKMLIAATGPLLHEHGRGVTTRMIASAAGVAEGTIFRVFATKDELIDATVAAEFEAAPLLGALAEISAELPLRERLVAMVAALQERFFVVFRIMRAMGSVSPPPQVAERPDIQQGLVDVHARMLALVEPDGAALSVTPDRLLLLIRLLTFSGSHAEIADGEVLAPEEIVDTVLHGVLIET